MEKNENDRQIEQLSKQFKLNRKTRQESVVDRRKHLIRFINENSEKFDYYNHPDRIKDLFNLDRSTILYLQTADLSRNKNPNLKSFIRELTLIFPEYDSKIEKPKLDKTLKKDNVETEDHPRSYTAVLSMNGTSIRIQSEIP